MPKSFCNAVMRSKFFSHNQAQPIAQALPKSSFRFRPSALDWVAGLMTIGLISAIALPSFSCGPARRPPALTFMQTINRAQQTFYLQKNVFADSLQALDLTVPKQTVEYTYSVLNQGKVAISYAISREPGHRNYVGGVFLIPTTEVDTKAVKGEMTTVSILCVSNADSTGQPTAPTYQNGQLDCSTGTYEVFRSPR